MSKELPLSGYSIQQVYITEQSLKWQPPSDDTEDHGALGFGWDWRELEPRVFEIAIMVSVDPTLERAERLEARVVGRFHQAVDDPTVPLKNFAELQAVAILMPYVRQALSSLTVNSIHGTYLLPVLDVASLMHDFDTSKATGAGDPPRAVPALKD